MDVFGHVGLTLAAAYVADTALRPRSVAQPVGVSGTAQSEHGVREGHWLARSLDYRLVIAGSMLPDVLDKPLGLWLAPELVNHSLRSVGHTAVFAGLLLIVSFALLRGGWSLVPAVLSASSAGHLVLDQMWGQASVVLWPALGWAFPPGPDVAEWSASHLRNLAMFYRDPFELVGFLVILALAARVSRPGAFDRFWRAGAVA